MGSADVHAFRCVGDLAPSGAADNELDRELDGVNRWPSNTY
jgi:hypothetical protein